MASVTVTSTATTLDAATTGGRRLIANRGPAPMTLSTGRTVMPFQSTDAVVISGTPLTATTPTGYTTTALVDTSPGKSDLDASGHADGSVTGSDLAQSALDAAVAAGSNTYAGLGSDVLLPRSRRAFQANPAAFVIDVVGDSRSDETTSAAYMYARLRTTHTRPGEALYGMTSDVFSDGVTIGSGSKTFQSATANFTSADIGKAVTANAGVTIGNTIASIDSASQVQLTSNASGAATGISFSVGRHIINRGNNGTTLTAWLNDPSRLAAVVADNPNLIIASWLTNDVRLGQCDLPTATARLKQFITTCQAAVPNADILLHVPPPMLTTNVSSFNYVQTSGGTINPAGLAQTYSDLIRQAHLSLVGAYPNVAIADVAADVFGSLSRASNPLMADQLHASPAASWYGGGPIPVGGGYVAIADYLAKKIGVTRGGWLFDTRSYQSSCEFLVVAGGSGFVDIGSANQDPASGQYPVSSGDVLFVDGYDSPITLASDPTRPFGGNIRITGLTGKDFTGAVGRRAAIAGNHPGPTTNDRQIVSVDLPSVAAGAITTATVAVAGVNTANNSSAAGVVAVPPQSFSAAGLVFLGAYPANTNSVNVVVQNPTGGAIDRPAENWAFWVVR